MIDQLQSKSQRNLRAQLIARAWHDPIFKEKLLTDPQPAIEEELDLRLPEDLQVTVLEETPDTLYLILPGSNGALFRESGNGIGRQKKSEKDIQSRLIAKAGQDAAFKQRLLADPRPTIEQELGITLPRHLHVRVVAETPTHFCLVLPINRTELSEEQLNAPVGACTGDCATNCCVSNSASGCASGCGCSCSCSCGLCNYCNSASNCCW